MDLFDDPSVPALPFAFPVADGYDVTADEQSQAFHLRIPHGELFYAEAFFSKKISDRSVEYLLENSTFATDAVDWRGLAPDEFAAVDFRNVRWKQDVIDLYGKKMPLPRITSWYGDEGKSYAYSGIRSHPNQWNIGLSYIKKQVERVAGLEFNSVLLNWYRDGDDYLNWHSDDEKDLGKNPTIASVNFGATRDFLIRDKEKSTKISVPLAHGTLLIMSGEMQHYWQHAVPKRKAVNRSRINLTFRNIR